MQTPEAEIAARINEWAFFRDQERWEELLGSFHAGGTISLSWYDGSYEGFVAASKRLAASGNALLKHRLGVPRIRVRGERALSEVDVAILLRATTPIGEVDTTSHARFFDRLERRDGAWRIWMRTAIYEKDRADPVSAPSLPAAFFEGLERFPAEVRFLASSLDRVGAKLSARLVLRHGRGQPVRVRLVPVDAPLAARTRSEALRRHARGLGGGPAGRRRTRLKRRPARSQASTRRASASMRCSETPCARR